MLIFQPEDALSLADVLKRLVCRVLENCSQKQPKEKIEDRRNGRHGKECCPDHVLQGEMIKNFLKVSTLLKEERPLPHPQQGSGLGDKGRFEELRQRNIRRVPIVRVFTSA